jgi:predicted RNA-binding protein with PUA domain
MFVENNVENNVENKINIMEKQIIELQDKITKLEAIILKHNYNDYNDYNIKNEINLDNIVCNRSIDFSEPKLTRQHAFMRN